MSYISKKVLIESDWNLKIRVDRITQSRLEVLIESDWNLKAFRHCKGIRLRSGIKRIRLEFKDIQVSVSFNVAFCINRIRLEFKVFYQKRYFETLNVLIESDWNLKILAFAFNVPAASVLIESDWNLKDTDIYLLANVECGINRIRLEFKGGDAKDIWLAVRVLIESDWNLKSNGTG